MNDLHLKFKADTGTSATIKDIYTEDGDIIEVPTDDYLEWLEEIATNWIASEKLRTEINELKSEVKELCFAVKYLSYDDDLDNAQHLSQSILYKLQK